MIYLLSVYSESVNHSLSTCPVFHLLLCLPQRPNSLGKESGEDVSALTAFRGARPPPRAGAIQWRPPAAHLPGRRRD